MSDSLFEFWAQMPDGAARHPADAAVFDRVETEYALNGLPCPFMGPLRTAPIVLLFLSPGFDEGAGDHAATENGRAWYKSQRGGCASLPTQAENEPGWRWWVRTVRQLGLTEEDRDQVAFLDISAYPSTVFRDWAMLCALPSSRMAISWAQSVLFPEAISGKRVVVCLRSANYWGLGAKPFQYGKCLFAPPTTRRGDMLHGETRQAVINAVQARLAEPYSN